MIPTRAASRLLRPWIVAAAALQVLLPLLLLLQPASAFVFRAPAVSSSSLSSELHQLLLRSHPSGRAMTTVVMSAVPEDTEPGGLGSRRRQSRFNKAPKPPEEPKKEQRFSKDGHFYRGAIGIGTYSWGDRRDGFFYGDVRSVLCIHCPVLEFDW